jgi:F-type H+-transporting ATPase subunit delta
VPTNHSATAERIEAYAQAIFGIVAAEGYLGDTEEELFRFARAFESNDELRAKLSDRSIPVAVRQSVIEDLFAHRALESTAAVVSFLVGTGRVSELPAIVDRFIEIAADNRAHEVAEVRSAVALDAAQQQRLAAALSQATGKQVEVKVIVDEDVLGGIVARIGDTVIDGTVRRRLAQLKEHI